MDFLKLVEIELDNLDEILTEVRAVRKKSVRGGKVIKRKDCPKGYKLVGSRCVRMGSKERMTRKRAGKRSARKGKAQRRTNFRKSTRLRQRRNLKTKYFK